MSHRLAVVWKLKSGNFWHELMLSEEVEYFVHCLSSLHICYIILEAKRMTWREEEECSEKLEAFPASVKPSTEELGQCQEHTRIQDNPFDRKALTKELKEEKSFKDGHKSKRLQEVSELANRYVVVHQDFTLIPSC